MVGDVGMLSVGPGDQVLGLGKGEAEDQSIIARFCNFHTFSFH